MSSAGLVESIGLLACCVAFLAIDTTPPPSIGEMHTNLMWLRHYGHVIIEEERPPIRVFVEPDGYRVDEPYGPDRLDDLMSLEWRLRWTKHLDQSGVEIIGSDGVTMQQLVDVIDVAYDVGLRDFWLDDGVCRHCDR